MRADMTLRVVVDFEYTNELILEYTDLNGNWVKCFTIPNIYKFITKTKSFLGL